MQLSYTCLQASRTNPKGNPSASSHPRTAMRYALLSKQLIMRPLLRQISEPAQSAVHCNRKQCRAMAAARSVLERGKDLHGEPTKEQKAKALDTVMSDLNTRFGKGSIMKMGATPQAVECIPTGALTLDIALGGGFPKGRIIEIFGPESSGKSTLALHAIATVQKNGGTAALIDAEHAFDPMFSKRAGVDVENLVMCQPDSGEMALEVVDQLVRSSSLDIIAIDSVAALTPRAEIEGEIGNVTLGAQARLLGQALRKISGNASKCNVTIIFINQLRHKIGIVYGNPEVTTGGNALKYWCSVRLEVRRIKTLEGSDGEQVGIKVRAKVVKNKVAPPFQICEFDILFGSGISTLGCLIDAAEKTGIVKRRGAWYSYNEKNIGQGREKTMLALTEDPDLADEIEIKTRQKLTGEVYLNDILEESAAEPATEAEFPEATNVPGLGVPSIPVAEQVAA